MLPPVYSTTVPAGQQPPGTPRRPRSAASAKRSFIEPVGFDPSTFTTTRAHARPGRRAAARRERVPPIADRGSCVAGGRRSSRRRRASRRWHAPASGPGRRSRDAGRLYARLAICHGPSMRLRRSSPTCPCAMCRAIETCRASAGSTRWSRRRRIVPVDGWLPPRSPSKNRRRSHCGRAGVAFRARRTGKGHHDASRDPPQARRSACAARPHDRVRRRRRRLQ